VCPACAREAVEHLVEQIRTRWPRTRIVLRADSGFACEVPPVRGFWSLTMYDEHHFFVPNGIKRYSLGTKNKDLRLNADGSLTIYVQSDPPTDPARRANWLPSPAGADFTLFPRTYWPDEAILTGAWTPPPVQAVN
jgi:hypothetical protein